MRGATVVEVKSGEKFANVTRIAAMLGVEIVASKLARRPGWVNYTLRSNTKKHKIIIEPGYLFIGMSYFGGPHAKWKSLHAQTFPGEITRPVLNTYNLTTEDWYDLVRKLLEAGATGVRVHKKQFKSLALFERHCDEQGVWRIIQAERGLNK